MKMKVLVSPILTGVMMATLIGCSDCEPVILTDENVAQSILPAGSIRSVDEVVEIATELAEIMGKNQVKSRSERRTMRVNAITKPLSRNEHPDTLLFVVDYGDEEGFALIAASRELNPIIGLAEEGDFYSLEATRNEGFQYYMSQISESLSLSSTNPYHPTTPGDTIEYEVSVGYRPPKTILKDYEIIKPRLEVKWGAFYPEGLFCSNKVAGCVPIAIAKLMSYYEPMESLALTYDKHDKDILEIDWAALKKHKVCEVDGLAGYKEENVSIHDQNCYATMDNHLDLARLCRQIGHVADANYENKYTTSVYTYKIPGLLKQFHPGYTVSGFIPLDKSDRYHLYDAIKQGVVLVNGEDYNEEKKRYDGHAWLADGARSFTMEEYLYNWGDTVARVHTYTVILHHFDWGMNGICNGYFADGVFNTTESYPNQTPSDLEKANEHNFRLNVKFITIK